MRRVVRTALRLPAVPRLSGARLFASAPTPAICAVQLSAKPGKRAELEDWLCEGRLLLESTLHEQRPKSSVAAASIVGTPISSCFHWIHVPSADTQQPDTVAIVFTSDADLSLWRQRCPREHTAVDPSQG